MGSEIPLPYFLDRVGSLTLTYEGAERRLLRFWAISEESSTVEDRPDAVLGRYGCWSSTSGSLFALTTESILQCIEETHPLADGLLTGRENVAPYRGGWTALAQPESILQCIEESYSANGARLIGRDDTVAGRRDDADPAPPAGTLQCIEDCGHGYARSLIQGASVEHAPGRFELRGPVGGNLQCIEECRTPSNRPVSRASRVRPCPVAQIRPSRGVYCSALVAPALGESRWNEKQTAVEGEGNLQCVEESPGRVNVRRCLPHEMDLGGLVSASDLQCVEECGRRECPRPLPFADRRPQVDHRRRFLQCIEETAWPRNAARRLPAPIAGSNIGASNQQVDPTSSGAPTPVGRRRRVRDRTRVRAGSMEQACQLNSRKSPPPRSGNEERISA